MDNIPCYVHLKEPINTEGIAFNGALLDNSDTVSYLRLGTFRHGFIFFYAVWSINLHKAVIQTASGETPSKQAAFSHTKAGMS